MVPAGQDVLDAEPHEAPDATRAARVAQLDPGLARIGGERELGGLAGRIDPGQRVVVGAEHVEEVVADPEVTDLGRARVAHHRGDALDGRRGIGHRSGPGVAAPPASDQRHLVPDEAEESVAARAGCGAGEAERLGHLRGQGRGPERERVASRRAIDRDRRVAVAAAGVGDRGARRGHREERESDLERASGSHGRASGPRPRSVEAPIACTRARRLSIWYVGDRHHHRMPHRHRVPAHRVRREMADGVLHQRLRLPRAVDEHDHLGSGDTVRRAVAFEREVALDARPTEGVDRARDARRLRRIGLVGVRALGRRVNAVVEPGAGRVALEAVQPPRVGDLDRARAARWAPATAGVGRHSAPRLPEVAGHRRTGSLRSPRPAPPARPHTTSEPAPASARVNAASTTRRCPPPRAAPG